MVNSKDVTDQIKKPGQLYEIPIPEELSNAAIPSYGTKKFKKFIIKY